jgi:hypothetical protein
MTRFWRLKTSSRGHRIQETLNPLVEQCYGKITDSGNSSCTADGFRFLRSCQNIPQPLTKNLNLPPDSINFDLSDLIDAEQKQREQKQRNEWAKYQAKMTTAYTETQAFTESESAPAAGV